MAGAPAGGRSELAIPAVVRNKAAAVGAPGWIDDLPGLVADIERDWSIRVGRPYQDATEAFVAEATRSDGFPVVLKLLIPRPGGAVPGGAAGPCPARRPGARSRCCG